MLIQYAGAAYLVWLGIRAIRHPPNLTDLARRRPALGSLVLRGILVLWSNPKAFLFIGALVPQFIVADAPLVPQLVAARRHLAWHGDRDRFALHRCCRAGCGAACRAVRAGRSAGYPGPC